jgi:hypothetical protein
MAVFILSARTMNFDGLRKVQFLAFGFPLIGCRSRNKIIENLKFKYSLLIADEWGTDMADYESGRQALQRLADMEISDSQQVESARNEASTRYHIIDLLVTDVLCWDKSAVNVERHEDSGYSDYELGSPPSLLLEAKKEGAHFSLPAGWDKETAKAL